MKSLLALAAVLALASASFAGDNGLSPVPYIAPGTVTVQGSCPGGRCPVAQAVSQAIPHPFAAPQGGCSTGGCGAPQGRRFMPFGGRLRAFR